MALVLVLKVIPRSAKTEFAGVMEDGTRKLRVAAPADKGKANAALVAFLAAHYGVPRDAVRIVSGATSTRKQVRIEGVD
ncbi:MAG: DUF167 domain-containing protein [Bryobacterales bacterium]|nr:DUF167 domain-containing protein [Bryobacterales bacterium]